MAGKRTVDGLVLDPSVIERTDLGNAEHILGTHHLASSLRSPDLILYDRDGWLSELQHEVGAGYGQRIWIGRRCDAAVSRILSYLESAEQATSDPQRAISWLFGVAVTTHIYLVAGLRNPTVRRRYESVRGMLDDFDRPDLYPPLLDLINPTNLSATDVTGLIEFLVDLFDATLPVPKAGFPFAGDISPTGRLGAIDDSLRLVASGHPRDATVLDRCYRIPLFPDPRGKCTRFGDRVSGSISCPSGSNRSPGPGVNLAAGGRNQNGASHNPGKRR